MIEINIIDTKIKDIIKLTLSENIVVLDQTKSFFKSSLSFGSGNK